MILGRFAGRLPQLFLGLTVVSVGLVVGAGALRDGLKARSRQDMITVTGSADHPEIGAEIFHNHVTIH